jgi:hypothetical protein
MADALTQAEVDELEAEGMGELVVKVGGKLYNSEDIWSCSGCNKHVLAEGELDDGECEDCAAESREADDDLEELRADWRAGRL